MFLKSTRWDTRSGQHSRGSFLMLVERKNSGTLLKEGAMRALVRYVTLNQCGHWMMGEVHIGGHRLSLSGTYGCDGLPLEVPDEIFEHAVPVPMQLVHAWNKGGGHNSGGSEMPLLAAWAKKNLKALRKPFKRSQWKDNNVA